MQNSQQIVLALVALSTLAACEVDGGTETVTLTWRDEYAWECPYGGTKRVYGWDRDGDGLEDGEIEDEMTSFWCDASTPQPYVECYSDLDCAYYNQQFCSGDTLETRTWSCQSNQCVWTQQEWSSCAAGCSYGACLAETPDPLDNVEMWITYVVPTSIVTQFVDPSHIKLHLECYDFDNPSGFGYFSDLIGNFDPSLNNQEVSWSTGFAGAAVVKTLDGCHATGTLYNVNNEEFPLNGGYFSVGIMTNTEVQIAPVYNMCPRFPSDSVDFYWFYTDWQNLQITPTCDET